MTNELIKNDTAISLAWNAVDGATEYQVQVSQRPEFTAPIVNASGLVSPAHAFTDGGDNDKRRYWRWRYLAGSWSQWQEPGSYWYGSGFGADYSLSNGKWAFINPLDVTDHYVFETAPVDTIIGRMITRATARNRLGDLLSEYVTTKDEIALGFEDEKMILHSHYTAIRRFGEDVQTFFIAAVKWNGTNFVPNIWKVQFLEPPEMTMVAGSRPDLLEGELKLVEV